MQHSLTRDSGVYKITCVSTGHFYIGSTKDFKGRFSTHFNELRYEKHYCKKLQDLYNEHGENGFVFSILDLVDPKIARLIDKESEWMELYGVPDNPLSLNKKLAVKHKNRKIQAAQKTLISLSDDQISELKRCYSSSDGIYPWDNTFGKCCDVFRKIHLELLEMRALTLNSNHMLRITEKGYWLLNQL